MADSTATHDVAIIGLGYVGLPLCLAFADAGLKTLGVDTDAAKVADLAAGRSYIKHIPAARVASAVQADRFHSTTDFSALRAARAILICVPTPLTPHRVPDLGYVIATAESIAPHVRRGQLICLESTTYPGTTDDVLIPLLEAGGGLRAGADFLVAFSPEREDPSNPSFRTATIPKVVGGHTPAAAAAACACSCASVSGVAAIYSAECAAATCCGVPDVRSCEDYCRV